MPPLLSFLLFFPLLTLSSPLPFPTVTQPPTTNDASLTIIGSWTLSSFARSCSPVDNLCNYAFDLQEGPKPSRDLYTCFMSANGTSQTDFSRIECAGFGDRFLVNGGWNGQGTRAFLTLVVTDQVVGGYAFFGIAEGSFDEVGIVESRATSAVYAVGTLPSSDDIQVRSTELQPALQILRLKRDWKADDHAINMAFLINDTRAGVSDCSLRIPQADPKGSWYAYHCGQYSVSWGYIGEKDAAVMTVCDPSTGMDAFFGYDHVGDASAFFGDSPWEPLHKTGCT